MSARMETIFLDRCSRSEVYLTWRQRTWFLCGTPFLYFREQTSIEGVRVVEMWPLSWRTGCGMKSSSFFSQFKWFKTQQASTTLQKCRAQREPNRSSRRQLTFSQSYHKLHRHPNMFGNSSRIRDINTNACIQVYAYQKPCPSLPPPFFFVPTTECLRLATSFCS